MWPGRVGLAHRSGWWGRAPPCYRLETMATEDEKNTLDESSPDGRSNGDLFTGAVQEENLEINSWAVDSPAQLSEQDVFVGDQDFYKLLDESSRQRPVREPVVIVPSLQEPFRYERLSSLQKVLIGGIIVLAAIVLFGLLRTGGRPNAESPLPSAAKTTSSNGSLKGQAFGDALSKSGHPQALQGVPEGLPVEASTHSPQVVQEPAQEQKPGLRPAQPLSLEFARSFFQQRQYDKAYTAYDQLRQALPAGDQLLRDFLQLEMALCKKESGDLEEASRTLVSVSQSRSPAVRIVSNYHLSLLEIQRKRFLRARTRAYNAMALIKAVSFNDDWALAFECDCHFLIAECLSRHILMLSNADTNLPEGLWGSPSAAMDPFADLQEAALRQVLSSGSEDLGKGLLDPRIRKLDYAGDPPRWSVTSDGAPVEELMAKFAVSADIDLHWALEKASGPGSVEGAQRQRPVSLHLPAATSNQVVLTAAGCAGLLACPEDVPGGKLKVTVSDPTRYTSLDKHLSVLSQQAVSLWQKFVLTFYSDKRLANAHFVMGLLQSQMGLPTEAIAEYKLVANRFSQMSLAPYALLHSSKLKTNLRDYQGARDDLKQLIEQYPDAEVYGQAYLGLADATKQAGLKAEAGHLYERVYNFGLSVESKTASALGAAECLYDTKAYDDAAKWLTRYIQLAGGGGNTNLYGAYFLLGEIYQALGKHEQACNAFRYALAMQSSREQYVKALAALVKGHIQQEQYVEALEALENVSSVALSEEQSVEMLLLKCRILRMMGLIETAINSLRDRAEYVSDPQLSAELSFELAQCHVAAGDLELARNRLSEILGIVKPGPLAQDAAMELADVCLKLGRSSQSISVCLQLLNSDTSAEMRQQMLKTLAAAYNQQKDYDKAARALSGQWK
jgi:tetratricopeptide (TPR) repeat protein